MYVCVSQPYVTLLQDKEKVLTVAGIDIAEFEDFEPNLDHVDPKTDVSKSL